MTKTAGKRGAMADKILAVFKPGEWLAPGAVATGGKAGAASTSPMCRADNGKADARWHA